MTNSNNNELMIQHGETFKKNLLGLIPEEVQNELKNANTEKQFREILKQHAMDLDDLVRKAKSTIPTDLPDEFLSTVAGGWAYTSGDYTYDLKCPNPDCRNGDRNKWTWHPIDTWMSDEPGLIYTCDNCHAKLRVYESEYGFGGVFVKIIG